MQLHRTKGMTLIEILIVVVIIAVIAAISIPFMLNALQRSKRSRAMSEIRAISSSMFAAGRRMRGSLTATENVPIASILTPDIYDGATKDPWGGDYLFTFKPETSEFFLLSLGRDRAVGFTDNEYDSDIIFKNGKFIAPANQ